VPDKAFPPRTDNKATLFRIEVCSAMGPGFRRDCETALGNSKANFWLSTLAGEPSGGGVRQAPIRLGERGRRCGEAGITRRVTIDGGLAWNLNKN
jgi:hypothetical protein